MCRHCLYSIATLFLLAPIATHAALVVFDHIEYDPDGPDDGREWVRITNISGAPLDLTGWRFVEGGTNHKLKALASPVVPAGGSAIIADEAASYATDHPASVDILFDSSFSLSNSGENIALKNASSTVMAETTYTAVPKQKPTPVIKTKPVVRTKKDEPRLLQKVAPVSTATALGATAKASYGFWSWLIAALALGIGAGVALIWVRQSRSGEGFTVIDISDKSD